MMSESCFAVLMQNLKKGENTKQDMIYCCLWKKFTVSWGFITPIQFM